MAYVAEQHKPGKQAFIEYISKVNITSLTKGSNKKIYQVTGQLFFASVTEFLNSFDYKEDVKEIDLDLSNAHLWDYCDWCY